ncbi:hypothetical protein HQ325_18775 [Rhodococcus sp. BP-349]|uniref:hypothetical protein n=1 Tax=unclassified Rhodococcus (in: high G+C Gram-positive bacteria) TaxID=192944 RepID=UPI001C9BAF41|nr:MULTISPECIES: hypothetical protein [unclassified Rhodococcus (in: high G+C Gram-positive bacteria)]MBY6540717.1 hypothetical protein [Rhodococcus sp. BP-363]MBY6545257.1 hypothetical protein [Rhodococcus sp. BP-369]MBY6564487.1 hypothetical protein [Rhodococcus sp. BP-370]MBY6578576.1 hypothetical protein [Rhodococcus sp. BP-364]MBY6587877.1 hypothetical protein [Rhodococcus sp. BP-358]
MDEGRRDLAAELRVLAELLIDRVEPVLRRLDTEDAPEWQGCSWCPFCALAAALRGERHDLLTLVTGEMDGLIDVLRDFLQSHGSGRHAPGAAERADAPEGAAPPVVRPATYQPITVTRTREPDPARRPDRDR